MATVRWRIIPLEGGGRFLYPCCRLPKLLPGMKVRTVVEANLGVGTFKLQPFEGHIRYITESGTFADVDFGNGIYQFHAVKGLRRI